MTDYKKLQYDNSKVQVESAIRDGNGMKIDTNYAKKSDVSVQFTDVSIVFTPQSTPDYEDYPYRGSFTSSMITANTYASVTYSDEQATSLNFSPFCDTAAGVLYIYSRTDVGTQVIPTINLGGGPTEIAIDSTPTSGSGNAVSSNGVYNALINAVMASGVSISDDVVIYDGNTGKLIKDSGLTLGTSVPSDAVFTDTHVTSVNDHYTPVGTTSKDASGGTLTDIANSTYGTQVVTGVNIDATGHVTGVKSVALKATNNTYTVGNATITVQKNGTAVDTFTTNATSNKTINMRLPLVRRGGNGGNDTSNTQSYNMMVVGEWFSNYGNTPSVTFPQAFTTRAPIVAVTPYSSVSDYSADGWAIISVSTTGFTVKHGSGVITDWHYIALGRIA